VDQPPGEGEDLEMLVDEKDLVDIDLDLLEEAYNKKEIQSLPPEQLYKVHKVYIDSTVGLHLDLEEDWESIWTPAKTIGKFPRKSKTRL
jgi:hypothetical protein